MSRRCVAAWVICSKPLAGGGKPMREGAWILQFTHVECGKHSLERRTTKWRTHTTRIPYPVPRVIYHTRVNIRKHMCNLLIIAHEYSHTRRVRYSLPPQATSLHFSKFLYTQNCTRTNCINRLCCNFSSQTVHPSRLFATYHTHLVKLNHFCCVR